MVFDLLGRGQTNFLRMLWKFNTVYNPQRQYDEHWREVPYALQPPPGLAVTKPRPAELYVHLPSGRSPRQTGGGHYGAQH